MITSTTALVKMIGEQGVNNGWVDGTLYYYDGITYRMLRADGAGDDEYLRPWRGYWLLSYTTAPLCLAIPDGVPQPALQVEDVQVTNITPTTAVVSWNTPLHSTSRVDYGLTSDYTETTGTDPTLTRFHSVKLTGLAPNTEFHFCVVSTLEGYKPGVSSDATFTTASSSTIPANAGFELGTLDEWIPWPDSNSPMLQVGTQSALGPINPHSGSYLAYTTYSTTDRNGGLYARVSAIPGHTYEASVWSNLYMVGYTDPPPPDEDCRSRVGIDPTGGQDTYAGTVIWSAWDQRPNRTPPEWRKLSVQAEAQYGMVTIFLEFYQHFEEGYHQMVNAFDDAQVVEVNP